MKRLKKVLVSLVAVAAMLGAGGASAAAGDNVPTFLSIANAANIFISQKNWPAAVNMCNAFQTMPVPDPNVPNLQYVRTYGWNQCLSDVYSASSSKSFSLRNWAAVIEAGMKLAGLG